MEKNENYFPGKFHRDYYHRCEKIKQPLSDKQKKELEEITQEFFGFKTSEPYKKNLLDIELLRRQDNEGGSKLAHRLIRILRRYVYNKHGFDQNKDISLEDDHALDFYFRATGKYDIPERIHACGDKTIRFLEKYLKNKKLIP